MRAIAQSLAISEGFPNFSRQLTVAIFVHASPGPGVWGKLYGIW